MEGLERFRYLVYRLLEFDKQGFLAEFLHQAMRIVDQQQSPFGNNTDPVSYFLGFFYVVCCQDNRDPGIVQSLHHFPHILA